MQKDLEKAKLRLQVIEDLILKGDIHPDPDWSWDLEVICLEHDIAVFNFAIEKGHTDFNQACEACYKFLN
jgi:hypothetical protein